MKKINLQTYLSWTGGWNIQNNHPPYLPYSIDSATQGKVEYSSLGNPLLRLELKLNDSTLFALKPDIAVNQNQIGLGAEASLTKLF